MTVTFLLYWNICFIYLYYYNALPPLAALQQENNIMLSSACRRVLSPHSTSFILQVVVICATHNIILLLQNYICIHVLATVYDNMLHLTYYTADAAFELSSNTYIRSYCNIIILCYPLTRRAPRHYVTQNVRQTRVLRRVVHTVFRRLDYYLINISSVCDWCTVVYIIMYAR